MNWKEVLGIDKDFTLTWVPSWEEVLGIDMELQEFVRNCVV